MDGKTVSERDVAHGRCKKTKNRIGRRPPEAAVRRAKAAKWRKRGSMLNECNCGPAHLRRARSSIRMRDVLVGSKNSCDQTGMRESSRKLGTKDHGIRRNSTHRNAMLCYALGWHSVDMPSPFWNKFCDRYENWRPSRRKRWEGYGNGRCAHRRINHTRWVAAGPRPTQSVFRGSKISAK